MLSANYMKLVFCKVFTKNILSLKKETDDPCLDNGFLNTDLVYDEVKVKTWAIIGMQIESALFWTISHYIFHDL